MGKGGSTSLVSATALALLFSATPARAAETVRLAWSRGEGADGCIGEAELVTRVRSRLGSDPFADDAERVIEGHAQPIASGFRAELLVRARDGSVLGRRAIETAGESCSALDQAVTLAVVLTIDPNARLTSDETSTASFPIDEPRQPNVTRPSAPPVPERAPPAAARPCPSCAPPAPGVGFSTSVVGTLGILPRAALGAELEGAYPALPSALVVGLRVLPSVDAPDGHLAVGLTSGKVGYCGALADSRLAFSVCGALEVGVTTAVALDLTPVNPGDYPYLALAVGPRAVWPARSPIELHAGVQAIVPMFRQRFQVEGAATEAQSWVVGGALFLGVGVGG